MGWLDIIWHGWTGNMALILPPVFIYLSDELIMTLYWYLCNLQPYIIPNLVNTALKRSSLLQNVGWPGIIWRGWTSNLSLIALKGFIHLSDELRWLFIGTYPYNLQSYKVVFFVASATQMLYFAPNYRLPGENMVGFGKKSGFDCPHSLHVSFWWINVDCLLVSACVCIWAPASRCL